MFFGIFPIIFIGLAIYIARRIYHANKRQRYTDRYGLERYGEITDRILAKNPKEGELFKIAHKYRGRITLSDIVLETGMSIKEAENFIEPLVDGMHIRMEVSDKGFVVYEFPEIIARFEQDSGL